MTYTDKTREKFVHWRVNMSEHSEHALADQKTPVANTV